MDSALFDYDLPERLIAQTPAAERDASRLLVVDRKSGALGHARFRDLPDLLPSRSRLIRNTVSVLKARLRGQRQSGGAMECLLITPAREPGSWWCLLRPGKKVPPGSSFRLPDGATGFVEERGEDGQFRVRFGLPNGVDVLAFAQRHGEMPLPPYIQRKGEGGAGKIDEDRYQTTFADSEAPRAIAAPTAGLHFTPQLDERIVQAGHQLFSIKLHVGIGTFKPIQSERIEDHQMHSEFYHIPPDTMAALADVSAPRLCVGTTSLRAVEDYRRKGAPQRPGGYEDSAKLFIYPPSEFGVEHLITNFHLPRSTLMCLVSAFLCPGSLDGIKWLKELYAEAIRKEYRFYSYGDAMLIL